MLLNTHYLTAMNPTAGSFTINPRLQRLFATFAVGFPSAERLSTIYSTPALTLSLTLTLTLTLTRTRNRNRNRTGTRTLTRRTARCSPAGWRRPRTK